MRQVKLSTTDIRRMVRSAYGQLLTPVDDDFILPLPRTRQRPGHSLLVRLANQQLVVLRIAPPPEAPMMAHETDMMRGEVEALQVIAENTGVDVPAMHHHDDTHELVGVEWFSREHLAGEPLAAGLDDLDEQQRVALRTQLTERLRALRTITGEDFGRFMQPTMDSWQDAFSGVFEDTLADAATIGSDLGMGPDELHGLYLYHSTGLDAVTEPVFCLWRLAPDDVIVGPDGEVAGLVRPDSVFWGDPLMDPVPLCPADHLITPEALQRARLYRLHRALVNLVEADWYELGPDVADQSREGLRAAVALVRQA